MESDPLKQKPKGIMSSYKNEDGSYKKWAYVLFTLAAIFFFKDIVGLTGIGGKNAEYSKEVKMVAQEALIFGNTAFDESINADDYKMSDYEYKFAGPRIMHKYLIDGIEIQRKMEKDLDEVEGRQFGDVELYELNDLRLLKEIKESSQKVRKITEDFLLKEEELFQTKVKQVEEELVKFPDDNVLVGWHDQYLETGAANRKLVSDAGKSMLEMYDELDALIDFLILNHGKYEFTKEGDLDTSDVIFEKFEEVSHKFALAAEKYEKAQDDLMDKGTNAVGELNKLMEDL